MDRGRQLALALRAPRLTRRSLAGPSLSKWAGVGRVWRLAPGPGAAVRALPPPPEPADPGRRGRARPGRHRGGDCSAQPGGDVRDERASLWVWRWGRAAQRLGRVRGWRSLGEASGSLRDRPGRYPRHLARAARGLPGRGGAASQDEGEQWTLSDVGPFDCQDMTTHNRGRISSRFARGTVSVCWGRS